MSIKKVLFISIFSLIFSFEVSEAFDFQGKSSFELQEFAETTLKIDSLQIRENNLFPALQAFLGQHCSPGSITNGKKLEQEMKPTWKQHLEKISSNEKLEEQFSLLKKLNAGLERRDTERFCSQKWLLYKPNSFSKKEKKLTL